MCLVWIVLNHFKTVYYRIVEKCKFFENNPFKLHCYRDSNKDFITEDMIAKQMGWR